VKILVTVKRVVDYNVKVRVKPDGSDVDIEYAKMSPNPFDEIAIEEAVRLKEAGIATEIVAVSCGTEQAQDVLRTAMALGADRAILLRSDQELQPLAIAKLIVRVAQQEQPDLIIMGKQAIDDDASQTGPMTAALLGWPQATFVSSLKAVEGVLQATREIDGGLETLSLALPALITADLRLNEPRFASLPKIMQARKKTIEVIEVDTLGVDIQSKLKTLRVAEPPERKAGIRVNSVHTLVQKLKEEAKVL
jgi:electron transfer flavoprotein beta subunit